MGHVVARALRQRPAGVAPNRPVVVAVLAGLLHRPPREARAVEPTFYLCAAAISGGTGLVPLAAVDVGIADVLECEARDLASLRLRGVGVVRMVRDRDVDEAVG